MVPPPDIQLHPEYYIYSCIRSILCVFIPDLPCGLVLLGLQPGHDGAVNKLAQGAGELLVGFQVGAAEHPLRRCWPDALAGLQPLFLELQALC